MRIKDVNDPLGHTVPQSGQYCEICLVLLDFEKWTTCEGTVIFIVYTCGSAKWIKILIV